MNAWYKSSYLEAGEGSAERPSVLTFSPLLNEFKVNWVINYYTNWRAPRHQINYSCRPFHQHNADQARPVGLSELDHNAEYSNRMWETGSYNARTQWPEAALTPAKNYTRLERVSIRLEYASNAWYAPHGNAGYVDADTSPAHAGAANEAVGNSQRPLDTALNLSNSRNSTRDLVPYSFYNSYSHNISLRADGQARRAISPPFSFGIRSHFLWSPRTTSERTLPIASAPLTFEGDTAGLRCTTSAGEYT